MENTCNSKDIYLRYLETALIVGIGMYLHLNQISIIEMQYSKLPGLQPNYASAIFTFSVLCILAVLRPFWPSRLKKPPRRFCLILELAFTLYLTDLVLRQVWVPLLRVLAVICTFLGQNMAVLNRDLLYSKLPALSIWMEEEFFYLIRMVMALTALFFMSEVTGLLEIASKFVNTLRGEDFEASTGGRDVRKMESQARQMARRLWDNEDTPSVSLKPRRRRTSRSHTKRRTQIYLDHDPDEISC